MKKEYRKPVIITKKLNLKNTQFVQLQQFLNKVSTEDTRNDDKEDEFFSDGLKYL